MLFLGWHNDERWVTRSVQPQLPLICCAVDDANEYGFGTRHGHSLCQWNVRHVATIQCDDRAGADRNVSGIFVR